MESISVSPTIVPFLQSGQTLVAPTKGRIVSNKLLAEVELIVGYWIVFALSILGVVTNSLTLAVFLRQGFRDSVNVSLFSIAVWDQIKCVAGVIYRLYGPIGLAVPAWGITWRVAAWPALIYLPIFAGYVSYGLATYVSVERCLSVSIPFKVKSLITPRLTTSVMIVLSIIIFGSFSPVFFIYETEFVFNAYYNTSIAKLRHSDLYYAEDEFIPKLYKFLGISYPAVFCTVMTGSSAVIVFHLRKSAANFGNAGDSTKETNLNSASGRTSSNMTAKEVKVTKMLLVVILVYLLDFFPRLCKYIGSLIEPDLFAYARLHNLMLLLSNILWILDFINASVNFFIFMAMSTNFKKTFYEIFPHCAEDEQSGTRRSAA